MDGRRGSGDTTDGVGLEEVFCCVNHGKIFVVFSRGIAAAIAVDVNRRGRWYEIGWMVRAVVERALFVSGGMEIGRVGGCC